MILIENESEEADSRGKVLGGCSSTNIWQKILQNMLLGMKPEYELGLR